MAKIVIHAYTKDENNTDLPSTEELLGTLSNSLGGFVAWVDVVDGTNETTFKYEDLLEEE